MTLRNAGAGRITFLCLSISAALVAASNAARADALFTPGDLLVTTSTYDGNNSTVTANVTQSGGKTDTFGGAFNTVFQNVSADPAFGVTSSIHLKSYNLSSNALDQNTNLTTVAANAGVNLSTSFSSRSELALNPSSDGQSLSFMGYASAVNQLDVSNSNTTAVIDSTNPVTSVVPRAIGNFTSNTLTVTNVNAYSGNNGRAAVLVGSNYYLVGNAGNGASTGPIADLSDNTGVQMIAQGNSGNTTVVGAPTAVKTSSTSPATGYQRGFSITQVNNNAADKTGKDDNFRGMTVHNNTLYVTKGSGGNGINTVYQVGTAGNMPTLANAGTQPISILPGMPTTLAKNTTGVSHPFGLWFANDSTLYVADEGDGTISDTRAGLQKWTLANGNWSLDYTLQKGLSIGTNYTVNGGLNADGSANPNGTGQSWITSTGGLRNLTGRDNGDGTVTLYATTSTISTVNGDAGADPNRLVALTDTLSFLNAAQANGESFNTLQTAAYGEVLRGVAVAPVPLPAAGFLFAPAVALLGFGRRRQSL